MNTLSIILNLIILTGIVLYAIGKIIQRINRRASLYGRIMEELTEIKHAINTLKYEKPD